MKKESYIKKLVLEMKINNCLSEIDKAIISTIDYLSNDKDLEEDELRDELDYAQSLIKNVDELILALEVEYEHDINFHN